MLLVWFTGIWGLWTLGISLVGSFPQLLILRVVSGLGLGVFVPAAFSLTSDLFDHKSRTRAISIVRGVGLFGLVFAVLPLPMLAERRPDGWRAGFALMGFASLFTGSLMLVIPTRGASEPELGDVITKKAAQQYTFKWAELKALFKIKSGRYLMVNEVHRKSNFAFFTKGAMNLPKLCSRIFARRVYPEPGKGPFRVNTDRHDNKCCDFGKQMLQSQGNICLFGGRHA